MRRGEAGRSRRWHQKPTTLLADCGDERAELPDDNVLVVTKLNILTGDLKTGLARKCTVQES